VRGSVEFDTLTPREREVMMMVAADRPSKQIAGAE